MRRVSPNLLIDDSGYYHGRIRVKIEDVGSSGAKRSVIRKKSFGTDKLPQAQRELALFEAELRAPKPATAETVSQTVQRAPGSDVVTALHTTIAALEVLLAASDKRVDELIKLLTEQSSTKSGDAKDLATRPDFPAFLELHLENLRSTVPKKTMRTWEAAAKVVLSFCGSWEDFNPATIWGKRRKYLVAYHERLHTAKGLDGGVSTIAGGSSLNQLRTFLRGFALWRIEKEWATEVEFSALRKIKLMVVKADKVNNPTFEVLAEIFDRAKSVDLKLGRFLHLTFLLGSRKMTSIALRWEHCDLERATANLFVKGGRWEEVSLLTETVALLKEMKPPGATTGLVIPMSDRETKRASQW